MNAARFKRMALAVVMLADLRGAAFAAQPLRILMFGTSLTQGLGLPPGTELPSVLQAKLAEAGIRAQIINAGVSGDTSADGLSRIDWSLADHPDAAIVEMGSNDALRGLDSRQTEKNIAGILDKIRSAHVPVLLLGMKAPRNLGAEYDAAFDAIYPTLAARYHVLLYPFVLDGVALEFRLNQSDGLHPNRAGIQVIVAKLMPYVERLIGETRPTKGRR